MALAVVIFLLVIGSVIFHFASPWWFTDIAADWGAIDFTINVTFWVTGIVFIRMNLFLAYCVYKYRQKKGKKPLTSLKIIDWKSGFQSSRPSALSQCSRLGFSYGLALLPPLTMPLNSKPWASNGSGRSAIPVPMALWVQQTHSS